MRTLSSEEIGKFAARSGVKKIAVENFLGTMGTNRMYADGNLSMDARLYKWNAATQKAIRDGISLADKPTK